MNKDEYNIENKDENKITISFIKTAINNVLMRYQNINDIKEKQKSSKAINEILISDLGNLINSIENFEKFYKNLYKYNSNSFLLLKKNIIYIIKQSLNKQNKIFKEVKINKFEFFFGIFILYLKNSINEKKHEFTKKLFLIIIRLTSEKVIPQDFFPLLIEIFLNILIIIINSNQDYKFCVSDEPFTIINDIIESFVIFSKEIKLNIINNCLIRDIIDIFEEYLITPHYLNINFKSSSIWLKFLEDYTFSPIKEEEEEENDDDIDKDKERLNKINIKDETIQKKVYSFLINIYLFNMRVEYFQNDIMKKGIINLKYSINTLNYLIHLFKEEEKLQINNTSFKIKSGFYLQKDNFLFLPNIKLKINDFSIIFSFKITDIKDKDSISILNLYNKSSKSILHVFLDKNNYLNIKYTDKIWNTFIKIKENTFYLICISYLKSLLIGNSKLSLFINESINEELVKDENIKGIKIEDADSCYYYKKKMKNNNSIDLSKEFLLELGNNNFIGIVGEFIIINKTFTKENIHHLFNLKENYSKVLSQIYNNYGIINVYDSINWKKAKFGINKLNNSEERSISFFKQLGYEVKLEIMTYKINKFTKLKYFSQSFYNQELTSNIIKPITSKENNEMNLSLISKSNLSIKSGTNSLNSSSLLSNKNSNSLSFNNSSYFYRKDSYRREKINLNLNIFKLKYSSEVFFQNKGIEFLTMQLHNIISTVDDEKIFGIYLDEIINFIYKIMFLMFDNIIDTSNRQTPKLNDKISIFFLTLLTVLKKKKRNILTNNIVLKLLKVLDFFRINQLFIQRNMILSVLLEVKYYENESDIMKYPQLIKTITSDLNDDSNNDITIINSEILYKILMLDFIFELKEYKHKLLIKLISSFISKKNYNKEMDVDVINEFINYFLGLKNEIKIYHYLKIIYLNLSEIKKKLLKNEKFLENINIPMEKINPNHCKYCAYNQLLWYLIYEEICIKQSNENYCFHYNPIGFMKKPSIYFIKCIFIQCFSISSENKLKYVKTNIEGTKFILSIIKNNASNPNSKLDIKLAQIVEYSKFIPNFKAIIEYLKFLYEEQIESKDEKLLNIIRDSVKFIMSFLKEICIERKKNLKNLRFENNKDKWSIINTEYIINFNNEAEKKAKETKLIKKYDRFIESLLCCEGMKIFYYIYLSINYKKAVEDLKYFIDISINSIFNPFYFYFLSPNIDFNNSIINKEKDDNEHINDYIVCHIFNLLEAELTKSKLVFDEDIEMYLVKNNILLLIYIYQILIGKKVQIDDVVEKNVILFLNFLLDNYFFYSKYVFEVNILINDNLKDTQNKKFIIEMVVDILFFLYDNRNFDLKYQYLIKGIFRNKKISLKLIDEQNFLESRNQGLCYKFFNHDFFHDICKGIIVPEILYSIYFLYYLNEKMNIYKNKNIENKDNAQAIKLINEIMHILFVDTLQIFNSNLQKINYLRKNLINRYPYKIYKNLLQFIFEKYKEKEKSLTLESLVNHYEKLIVKNDINTERNTYFLEESLLFKNASIDIGINSKNSNNIVMETNTWKQPSRNKIKKITLNKIHQNYLKGKSKFSNNVIEDIKDNNLNNNLNENKRAKSNNQKHSKQLLSFEIKKTNSWKNEEALLKKILENKFDDYNSSNHKKSFNNSNELVQNNTEIIQENDDENIIENAFINAKEEIKLKNIDTIHSNELGEENENDVNQIIDKEKNKILKDDISDISEEESIIEEYDIKKKLKALNIPSRFYRFIFHLSDPNTLKILFNPKEYYIWNKFTIILKDIIYHNKKFSILTKIFNNKFLYSENSSKNNKFCLKYPTKLKNFICDDYYRPFIKPDINFFKHKLLPKSHSYLYNNIFGTNFSDEDNLTKIKFERILPINYDLRPTKKIVCELINNNGSIYGHIYFNHAFLLFISDNSNDPRNNKDVNEKQEEFFLYSYFLEERLKTKKKFEIMYFSEIKEIFIRRFFLNYIGYEIFMKDNRSHLFNFFNKNNLKKFLKIMSQKLELSYKKQNINNLPIYSQNENILSLPSLNYNISNEINFSVINDPISSFEKIGFKQKYQKGEISNFKYLLLLNKYSSRSYNDNTQYLVFPLLFMDVEKRVRRNLSKVICLSKENAKIDFFKENYQISGNHFNTHYSTCGYVLYYLVRLNPFTFGHIKLQSGHFDSPNRIFSSLENYICAISSSDENREFIPELFHNYEAFINLNHNNLGYIKEDQVLINDFNSNDKNGIIEYIINNRQELEKSNIIPWIDNIFGFNQLSDNDELLNIFPLSSYEQMNNFEEKKKKLEKEGKNKKQILKSIKDELCLLSVGVTPIQLFKTNHPLRNTTTKRLYSFFDGPNNSINSDKIVKSLSHKNLTNFINSNMNNKYQIFCLTNENNNFGMKLIIKSKKNVHILKMYTNENTSKANSIIKFELWKKKQIKIEPLSKICCELYPGIFCFCRYIDNVIQIKSEKQSFLYQYKCIITSLEFFSYNETKNVMNNNTIHISEILFGDEEGNLNLLHIEYEINNKKQNFNVLQDKAIIIKEIKAHNSFIQGILYLKRLNIIISYSEEGQITIINAYSFTIINIIELGEKYFIKDIKISDYDLMYIYCLNYKNNKEYIKCYTLNGIKATKLKTEGKINNFFVNEELMVVYENNLIELFNLYELNTQAIYSINPDIKIFDKENKKEIESPNNIVFCDFLAKDMKMLIIYQDHNIIIQDIFI